MYQSINSIPDINHQWSKTLTTINEQPTTIRTFKPRLECGLEGEWVNDLIANAYPNLANRSRKPYTEAMQCALFNLVIAYESLLRTGDRTGFVLSMTNTSRKQAKRYRVNDFTQPTLVKVVKRLAEMGLVSIYDGFKSKGYSEGLASLFMPTERFIDRITQGFYLDHTLRWFVDNPELITLKDDNSVLVDYHDDDSVMTIRRSLEETNRIRLASVWSYQPAIQMTALGESASRRLIHSKELTCSRKFKGSFSSGGRFYGSFQQLTQAERSTIQINGQPTCEIDIKSLHPRMLYNMEGLNAPDDCYALEGFSREDVKAVMLVSLNADSEGKAIRALQYEQGIPADVSQEIIVALRKAHKPLQKYLFKDSWRLLQYQDSCLADDILKTSTALGLPLLPIHDSFVSEAVHGGAVRDVIHQSYEQRFRFECITEFKN